MLGLRLCGALTSPLTHTLHGMVRNKDSFLHLYIKFYYALRNTEKIHVELRILQLYVDDNC